MARILSQFKNSELYFNRELSWLEFNRRVLDEAENLAYPLLERLKFLIIFSTNLDEFFMIRVAALKEQLESDVVEISSDGLSARRQLAAIREYLLPMYERHAMIWNKCILPELKEHDIFLHHYTELNSRDREKLKVYFTDEVLPLLTPLALDTAHPFPRLVNRSLNIIFSLFDENSNQQHKIAVLQLPSALPRFVRLKRASGWHYVLLEEIIQANSQALFPGIGMIGSYTFRVTRDAELEIAEDEAADLITEMREQIRQRPWGNAPVRLEIMNDMPQTLTDLLCNSTNLSEDDVYVVKRTLNFPEFTELLNLEIPELKDAPFFSRKLSEFFGSDEEIFESISKKDIIVHHPFDSFTNSVIRFLNAASNDPKVLAIKITLYRIGSNPPLIGVLKKAVENGKQVTAFVELKARFDEANNILWAQELELAGVHVVYGVLGLKTHCKIAMVVRRESGKLKTYLHLSTGNYNLSTSRIYTDIGLFTANEEFGEDAVNLFNSLTGYSNHSRWKEFSVAPGTLKSDIVKLINREIDAHSPDNQGLIIAKMNSLVDEDVIRHMYRASQKGVKIQLLVRGICCLRPGVKELSENIEVRSILGRFLEHTRLFYFRNAGNEEVYLASADWMPRNFERRVELMFPIVDSQILSHLVSLLGIYWKDNSCARVLNSEGNYELYVRPAEEEIFSAQQYFLSMISTKREDYT